MRPLSAAALLHLQKMEGAIPYVYDDGDGTWPKAKLSGFVTKGYPTIGVGHRIFPAEQARFQEFLAGGREMTPDEMSALLQEDIEKRIAGPIEHQIQVPITQSMWDALVSQAFNTGPRGSAVQKTIQLMNQQRWEEAAAALGAGPTTSKGKPYPGLVKRRAYEASLFMQDGIPGVMTNIPTWIWVSGGVASSALLLLTAWKIRRWRNT